MKGREGSEGGCVVFEVEGTGEGPSNRMSRLGLLPKVPGQQGPGQGETPAAPRRGFIEHLFIKSWLMVAFIGARTRCLLVSPLHTATDWL